MYKDWIMARLPADIPYDIIKYAEKEIDNNFGGYIVGLQFWDYGERGRPNELEYAAVDEDDLKLWLFERAVFHIALKMELINRAEEEKNWRYVEDHAEHGAWLYRENRKYQYNAIHDSRKFWMEYELRLLHPVFPKARWIQKVEEYEGFMNKWFRIKHLSYDTEALCFREISDSREYDTFGVQQPAEGSILPG